MKLIDSTLALSIRLVAFVMVAISLASLPASGASGLPEIDTLLTHLSDSGCSFSRNGSWYSALEARNHLQKKLDYLEQKGTVQTTEQFIELAASTSSVSGKPYWVKCGNTPATTSKAWLSAELLKIRSMNTAPSAPK